MPLVNPPIIIKADIRQQKNIRKPIVTQNDTVIFQIEVLENGVPFDLSGATTISLANTRKKDGVTVVTPGTSVGNVATFNLGTNELEKTGEVIAKAQFYDAEGRLSTLSFSYLVEGDPTGEGYVPSVNEMTLIESYFTDAQAKIDELSNVDVVTLAADLETTNQQLAEKTTYIKAEDIKTTKYSVRRPLFTLIDDDGRAEVMTKLKPLLDAKGFKAGFAIITGNVGATNYMPYSAIDTLYNEGHEILSHSQTHPSLHTLTNAQQTNEIKGSLDILNAKGYGVKGIVYPYSSQNEFTLDFSSKHYKYGFGGYGQNTTPVNSMYITRITIGEDESLTLANFKGYVDKAIADKTWLVLCSHIGTLSANALQILTDLIDYIATKAIDVVTPSQGYEIFGNMIESRNYNTKEYFAVAKTGEVFSTGIYRNFQTVAFTVDVNTSITSFDKDKLSVKSFLSADNSGFPGGAGTLYTYRHATNEDLSYQQWHPLGNNTIQFRAWDNVGKVWGAFKVFATANYVQFLSNDSKANTDLMASYPTGLSSLVLTAPVAATFGLPDAGVLYTYKFGSTNAGMNYQMFHEVATNNLHIRGTDYANAWKAWSIQATKTKKSISIPAQTIPANGTLDVIVGFSGLKDHHTIHLSPGLSIEPGVSFVAFYYNDNNMTVRFSNPTTTAKNLATRTWLITIS